MTGKLTVIIDGNCAFCNRSAHWLAKFDRRDQMRFYSFEGYQKTFSDPLPDPENGLVVVAEEGIFQGAKALSFLSGKTRFPMNLALGIFRILPEKVSEGLYKTVARNRYLFGKESNCSVPPPSLRSRFPEMER